MKTLSSASDLLSNPAVIVFDLNRSVPALEVLDDRDAELTRRTNREKCAKRLDRAMTKA